MGSRQSKTAIAKLEESNRCILEFRIRIAFASFGNICCRDRRSEKKSETDDVLLAFAFAFDFAFVVRLCFCCSTLLLLLPLLLPLL